MQIYKDFSLKELNTFRLDVTAKRLAVVESENDILEIINNEIIDNEKILILGEGSNILFQKNYDGLILKSELKGIEKIDQKNGKVILEVGSGIKWDDLVNYCVEHDYCGIENLSLIPGTVGAAPIQNIGAYGVEFEEVFLDLEGIELNSSKRKLFNKTDCEFGYRDSIFKKEMKNRFLITKIRILLDLVPKLKTSYRSIQDYIKVNDISESELNIKIVRDIVIAIRKSKLPDPSEIGNAGSFFKNPVITQDQFLELKEKFNDLNFFPLDQNTIKIPAGWLIEKVGYKGKRIGNVGVHDKQALVLVNYGEGKGSELVDLSNEIKAKIYEKFNIILEREVNIV